LRYFRYEWNASRGDEFADWGSAVLWNEMAEDGYVVRQLEVYENGVVLKYDALHLEDKYGFLSDQPLEPEKYGVPEVSAEAFEAAWSAVGALNQDAA
jgi:hypothetical protein